jgi:hypothetical protein
MLQTTLLFYWLILSLKTEAVSSTETSVNFYLPTPRHTAGNNTILQKKKLSNISLQ